jgi:hypothetical protein
MRTSVLHREQGWRQRHAMIVYYFYNFSKKSQINHAILRRRIKSAIAEGGELEKRRGQQPGNFDLGAFDPCDFRQN